MGRLALLLLTLLGLQGTFAQTVFPAMDDFMGNTVQGDYTLSTGCSVKIDFDKQCTYTTTGTPKNCVKIEPLLNKLFGAYSKITLEIKSIVPIEIAITDPVIKNCFRNFTLHMTTLDKIVITPEVMALNTGSVVARVPAGGDTLAQLDISGDWTVGNLDFSVDVKKTPTGTVMGGVLKTAQKITTDWLMNGLLKAVSPSLDISSTWTKLGLSGVELKNPLLKGASLTRGDGIRIGATVVSESLGNPVIYFDFVRLANVSETDGVVIGGSFSNVDVASMLKTLTGLDVSGVPYIGSIKGVSWKLLLSTIDLGQPLIPYTDIDLTAMAPLNKGLYLQMKIKFSETSEPQKVNLVITNKLIKFLVPGESGISVTKFLSDFAKDMPLINLPPKFNLQDFLDLRLPGFEYAIDTKVLTVPAALPDPIVFIKDAIEMDNATVKFSTVIGNGTVGINVTSKWQLGNLPITLNFSKPVDMKNFIAVAQPTDAIPFGELIKKFAVSLIPAGGLKDAIKKVGFESFYIDNAYLKIIFGTNPVMKVLGNAVIGNWDKCKAEVMIGKVSGATVMASGIVIGEVPVSKIVSTMTDGKIDLGKLPGSSILDNTDVAVVMSSQPVPSEEPLMQFSTPALANIQILDGVSLLGSFKFPSDCGSDQFCKVAKRLLGKNAQLVLSGRLGVASVYLSAAVPTEIQLFKGVNITDVGFEVEVGASRSGIGIKGTLKLKDPPLAFIGSFGQSTSGTYLQMVMDGMWKKPFGVNFLEIGDLMLRVAVTPDPTLLSALEIGGKGRLGKFDDPKAKPIEAQMYIGIDKVSPSQNYFMGKFSALTIPAFLKAFAYEPNLPKPLSEIGFPKGLNASFALQSKMLPNGVSIPRGFYLQGVLKVLFFEANSNIAIDLNGIFIDLSVKPFDIGKGLVAMSGRSAKMGPRIFVDIGWNPPRAFINIEGALTILKMKRTLNITVDHKGMSFEITGSFLNLFEAYLKVTTNYASMKTADFQVDGYFQQNLLGKLEEQVKSSLDDYKKNANKAIGNAQKKVDGAEKVFDDANRALTNVQNKLESQKAKFDAAVKTLQSKKSYFESKKKIFDNAVNKMTSAQNTVNSKKKLFDNAVAALRKKRDSGCPSACRRKRDADDSGVFVRETRAKRFIKRTGPFKRLFGRFRIGEKIKEAARAAERAREAIARAAREKAREISCVAKRIARATCLAAFKVAEGVVTASKRTLDVANGVLAAAKVLVDKSKVTMDAAKGLISVAQVAVDKSKGLVDVAKLAVEGAKKIVSSSKVSLDIANAALEAAKKVNEFGVMVGQKIASLGLGGLINVEELKFGVKLSIAETGHFRGSMKAKILGNQKNFSFNIKLKSVSSMVKSLVNTVKSALGIKKKRELEEQKLPALAGMKNAETVYIIGGPGCEFYDEMLEITTLVLDDVEDLSDAVTSLKEHLNHIALRLRLSKVTREDYKVLIKIGDKALHVGLDVIKELVVTETEMTEAELKALLELVKEMDEDDCMRNIAGILYQLLTPDKKIDMKTARLLLKKLHKTSVCLSRYKCDKK